MLNTIKKIIDWFNDEEVKSEDAKASSSSSSKSKSEDTHKNAVKHAVCALKRSGLALPYEVWDEFVVEPVARFDALYADKTLAMLRTATYAARIRRNYILPPNTPPEDVIHKEIAWVYGVFVAVMLHYISDDVTMKQLLGDNATLAVSADKDLQRSIFEAVKRSESSNDVIASILRQALAAQHAFELGESKEDINAAAESAKVIAPGEVEEELEQTVEPFAFEQDQRLEEQQEAEKKKHFDDFTQWLMFSGMIEYLKCSSEFYPLPAFRAYAEAVGIEENELIAEFEAETGLEQIRVKLENGSRHKGYKKGS